MIILFLGFIVAFIKYMIPRKTLLDWTNLFSPNDFKIDWWYIR